MTRVSWSGSGLEAEATSYGGGSFLPGPLRTRPPDSTSGIYDENPKPCIVITVHKDSENIVWTRWGDSLKFAGGYFPFDHGTVSLPSAGYWVTLETGFRPDRPVKLSGSNDYSEILDGIESQVKELSQDALEEEAEGQLPLSEPSRLGLVAFMDRVAALIPLNSELLPGLALTYEGEIVAEWRRSSDEKLVLEFLNLEDLKFIFFYPDSADPARIRRISGSGSVESFLYEYPRALDFLRSLK